jgi:hypothetical protein
MTFLRWGDFGLFLEIFCNTSEVFCSTFDFLTPLNFFVPSPSNFYPGASPMTRENDKVDPNLLTRAIWYSKGAAVLGLTGEIIRVDFEALSKGLRNLKG